MENRNENEEVIEISLLDIIQSIKERIVLVVAAVVICCILAGAYLLYKTPVYKSSVSMMVNPIKASSSMDDMLSSSLGGSSNKITTEVSLITSKQCLRNALNSLDLSKYSTKGVSYLEREFTDLGLEKLVDVKSGSDTKIVEITVKDTDANFASDYANAVASSFMNLMTGIIRTAKTSQRVSLENQIPENQVLLDQARKELLDYSSQYGTLEASQRIEAYAAFLSTLQLLKDPLLIQREQQEKVINENKLSDDIINVLSFESVASAYSNYEDAVKEYYLYQGSVNSTIDDRVLVLSTTMNNLSSALYKAISDTNLNKEDCLTLSQYFTIVSKINAITDIENQYKEEISNYEKILSGEEEYKAKVEMYQSLILSLNQMLEETKMIEAAAESDSSIIDTAEPAEKPFKPEKAKTLAIAFLLGVIGGCGIAIVLGLLDRSIYTEEDIKKVLDDQITSIGWIPYFKKKESDENKVQSKIVTNDPESYQAERFRILCANISLVANDAKVLIINSMGIGEGKSTVTVNIAASYAATGKKVLLVDCDLRRPELESIFDLKHLSNGISSVMKGTPVKDCIVRPVKELENLHFLPAGHSTSNPNIVFLSEKFAEMIKDLRKMYDLILLDCPPLSFGSDFMILSNLIDAYAIIARAGVATKDSLAEMAQQIKPIKARLLGYIFNGVLETSRSYGRYNYSNYSSYYSSSDSKDSKKKKKENKKNEYKKLYSKELDIRNGGKRDSTNLLTAEPVFAKKTKEASSDGLDFLSAIESDKSAKGKGSKK